MSLWKMCSKVELPMTKVNHSISLSLNLSFDNNNFRCCYTVGIKKHHGTDNREILSFSLYHLLTCEKHSPANCNFKLCITASLALMIREHLNIPSISFPSHSVSKWKFAWHSNRLGNASNLHSLKKVNSKLFSTQKILAHVCIHCQTKI